MIQDQKVESEICSYISTQQESETGLCVDLLVGAPRQPTLNRIEEYTRRKGAAVEFPVGISIYRMYE